MKKINSVHKPAKINVNVKEFQRIDGNIHTSPEDERHLQGVGPRKTTTTSEPSSDQKALVFLTCSFPLKTAGVERRRWGWRVGLQSSQRTFHSHAGRLVSRRVANGTEGHSVL